MYTKVCCSLQDRTVLDVSCAARSGGKGGAVEAIEQVCVQVCNLGNAGNCQRGGTSGHSRDKLSTLDGARTDNGARDIGVVLQFNGASTVEDNVTTGGSGET